MPDAIRYHHGAAAGGDEQIEGYGQGNGPGYIGAISRSRLVNLSHPISLRIPCWPGDPPPEFEDWSGIQRDGYYLRRFSMSEHAGTHLTAPASFYADGRTVDEFSPEELVRPAVVIDMRQQCQTNRDYALTVDDLTTWESRHSPVPAGSIALLLTGWAERWGNPREYLGTDADGGLHFPGFGPDAAALLVNERRVAGLGTDTAGVDPGIDGSFTISRLALAQPRIVLENLANLYQLPPTGAVLVIGLLPLEGGSGSPAAVTAFLLPLNE